MLHIKQGPNPSSSQQPDNRIIPLAERPLYGLPGFQLIASNNPFALDQTGSQHFPRRKLFDCEPDDDFCLVWHQGGLREEFIACLDERLTTMGVKGDFQLARSGFWGWAEYDPITLLVMLECPAMSTEQEEEVLRMLIALDGILYRYWDAEE